MKADTVLPLASRANPSTRTIAAALLLLATLSTGALSTGVLSTGALAASHAGAVSINPNQPADSDGQIFGPDGQELTDAECESLPGGNAPIRRLARLQGSMSVRNLELSYFGKPLHAFIDEDFEYLKILKPFCEGSPSDLATVVFDNLKEKVDEARETREKSIQWISETKDRLDRIAPSPEAIRDVHNAWTEMESRSQEMLAKDLQFLATYLGERRQAFYEGKSARQRVLISPFDPGPTIPPDAKE
jgi:hypothetical protein